MEPNETPLAPSRQPLTDREIKEMALALAYADQLNHGTDGHSRLILIAKLARLVLSVAGSNDEEEPHANP